MRVVFMGSPEFAVPVLELLVLNKHQVAAVYTRTDKPAGRGREPAATPVKLAAQELNLPVVQVPGFKTHPEAVEQLARFTPEAIVVAAYGQILPQSVLDIACYGCLNIHPSLLPRYRGTAPVVNAILSGDDFAGVSVMRLDAGMDSGPVFSRARIPILAHDTAGTLTPRLFEIGARMLLDIMSALPGGKEIPEPQDSSSATITREVTKEDGRIDWNAPAVKVWRQVRAYQPWPEAYTAWQGKQLKIIEAIPLAATDNPEPGRVVALLPTQSSSHAAFGVGTGEGVLGVLKVQLEGKRVMSADEFLRGQKEFLGSMMG